MCGYSKTFTRAAPSVEEFISKDSVQALSNSYALTSTYDLCIAVGIQIIHFGHRADKFFIEDPKENNAARSLAEVRKPDLKDYLLTDKEAEVLGGCSKDAGPKIFEFISKVPNYMVELVMCNQVKKLKLDNLKNYFKGAGVEISNVDYILKYLRIASGSMKKLVENDKFRDIAILNPFVQYHIAYASGGQLIVKSIEGLGAYADIFYTANEIHLAQVSAARVWDIKANSDIPDRAFIVAYAYLKASGILPDNWYQGDRIWQAAPAGIRKGYVGVFKKMTEFMAEVDGIEDVKTLEDLMAKIPDYLKVKKP